MLLLYSHILSFQKNLDSIQAHSPDMPENSETTIKDLVSEESFEKIRAYLKDHPIVVFMKGTQDAPLCGFSYSVVEILKQYSVSFFDVDVLQDERLRQDLKIFSQWPTFPQVYVKGELIGGCDIIQSLHAQHQLREKLLP